MEIMKKIMMLTVLAVTCASCAEAQKMKADKVPAVVTTAFAKDYPNAKKVGWEKEKSGDYEVGFEQGSEEMSVVYNNQGQSMEVETEMAVSSLPKAVQTALKGKKIKEAAKIVKNGQTLYEAEVGGKDLIFTADGKMISEEKD